MATFVTIGYGTSADYERTPEALRAQAHAHDDQLRRAGVTIGVAGSPVQVRNPEAGGVEVTEGPFLNSPLPIAGFAIIEADSLDEAIAMASTTPCAIAHGVVEVWPLQG